MTDKLSTQNDALSMLFPIKTFVILESELEKIESEVSKIKKLNKMVCLLAVLGVIIYYIIDKEKARVQV